jgi:hypothetical protein
LWSVETHAHPIESFGEGEWDRDKVAQRFGGEPVVLRSKHDPNGTVDKTIPGEDAYRTVDAGIRSRC